jgi:hypothetical protein
MTRTLAIAALLAMLTGCPATTDTPSPAAGPGVEPVAGETDASEEALLFQAKALSEAIVRRDRITTSEIFTRDFSCEVIGSQLEVLNDRVAARATACTGLGIPARNQTTRANDRSQVTVRRSEMEDVKVQITGTTATMTSTQHYYSWMPGDGDGERIANVTDSWRYERGAWRLARRVSKAK